MIFTYPSADGSSSLSILFDATPSEGHSTKVTITDNEVEDGAPTSDNVRKTPKSLSAEIVVSNTPITVPPDHMNGITGEVRELDLGVGGQKARTLQFSAAFDRARLIFDELTRISDAGTLGTVTTSLRTYESMAIASVDVARDASKANALHAKIEFREVRIAKARTVPEPVIPHARPRTTRGTQGTTEEGAAPEGSLLSRITGMGIRVRS